MTLFDLKTWKERPSRWKHLPIDWAFDAILFVPNGKAADALT